MSNKFYGIKSEHYPLLSYGKLLSILQLDKDFFEGTLKKSNKLYKPFDIQKDTTKPATLENLRHIDNPCKNLKHIQTRIKVKLLDNLNLPETLFGGIQGRSPYKNAEYHIGQSKIIVLDIKNCFPSINYKKIKSVFKNIFGCRKATLKALTQLTVLKNHLPQGAPSSPLLANLALLPLHNELMDMFLKRKIKCTFYMDDITISSSEVDISSELRTIIEIIEKHGYAVSHRKINIMGGNIEKKVTGARIGKSQIYPERKTLAAIRNDIRKLSNKKKILDYKLRSIKGRIENIKNISKTHGINLEKLYKKLLPERGINPEIKKPSYKIFSPCICKKIKNLNKK